MKSLAIVYFLFATIVLHLFSSASVVEAANVRFYCVPKEGASDAELQKAMDYACGQVDCSPIKPGGACAEPNTIKSRAAYAMNSYFMSQGGEATSCMFNGLATLTERDPSYGKCHYI